jgi:hypothetical protein
MKKIIALALLSSAACASQNALKSCHELVHINAPVSKADSELFIVIDQTVVLDKTLRASLVENIRPFIKPGNAFSVTQFSAYTQGHYASVLTSASFSPTLSDALRADTGKPQLQAFDQCLKQQQQAGSKLLGDALSAALAGSSNSVSRSDILSTLKEVAVKVKASPARNKVVLLSSDMLENSSISSFYSKQGVRQLEVAAELKKAEDNKMLADFGGARVYVMGAGLVVEDAKGSYRDPKTMQALESFWQEYFSKSRAKLVEFGKPALLNPIQ